MEETHRRSFDRPTVDPDVHSCGVLAGCVCILHHMYETLGWNIYCDLDIEIAL